MCKIISIQYQYLNYRTESILKEWKPIHLKELYYVTSILGLFLLKLPGLKTSSLPSIAIKINPVDASGTPTHKKGWDGH
jgi:hypothetical protein